MIERLAILGGSSVYIPELVQSIVSHNVNVQEIVLQGQEGRKLPIVGGFCQRLLNRSGFPSKVHTTTDIAEAVSGAKYVLNHVRVGGMKARMRDEKLPVKLGMVGNDTLGAGGIANALRTLPVVLHAAAEIERVNPEATFINLTNPMGIVMEALVKCSKLKAVGISDLPGMYIRRIARMLRLDPSHLRVDYVGLNHMGWIQDIRESDESLMPRVIELALEEEDGEFDKDLAELFRMIPTRHVSLYFHQDEVVKQQKTTERLRAEILYEAEQQILKLYEDETLHEIPEITRQRNAVWYEETIVPLIMAMENEEPTQLICCVRNDGAIRDLPEACSVEIPVSVSSAGIEPRRVGNCPRFLKGLFTTVKECDRLVVEAVRHKSYDFALQALTINPLVPSISTARKFLDRIVQEDHIELH